MLDFTNTQIGKKNWEESGNKNEQTRKDAQEEERINSRKQETKKKAHESSVYGRVCNLGSWIK
jgi:hypothetical protein